MPHKNSETSNAHPATYTLSTMENLPSFVDLMNSLGLEDKVAPLPASRPRPRPHGSGHRRAFSDTSSSELDSDLELLKRRRSDTERANRLYVRPEMTGRKLVPTVEPKYDAPQ